MPFARRRETDWLLRTHAISLGRKTRIMGILNVTPDSFSDGGRFHSTDEAVEAAMGMLDAGADIIDIGGESTRPGDYSKIASSEEAERVLPVIEGIRRQRQDAVLSIDSYRAITARQAVAAGVEIVNDVSGFVWDESMAATCAALACGVVLVHTRGRPEEWRSLPPLAPNEVVPLVLSGLGERLNDALAADVQRERIVLDPGFGFGKAFAENYPLLAQLDKLLALNLPLLAGSSRKGFLRRTVEAAQFASRRDTDLRSANVAANTAAILAGASILRVHDVADAVEGAAIADEVLRAAV